MNIEEFAEDTSRNTQIIRSTIRDIDATTLALAMVNITPSLADAILRNVSSEAGDTIRSEIERFAKSASNEKISDARGLLEALLQRHDKQTGQIDESASPSGQAIPRMSFDTKENIRDTIIRLAEYVRSNGVVALDGVDTGDPIVTKGLSMISGGYDPPDVRMILEQMKKTHLRTVEEKYAMILDGIESLQIGDHPTFISSKLNAHIPQ